MSVEVIVWFTLIITGISGFTIPFLPSGYKSVAGFFFVLLIAVASSFPAIFVLINGPEEIIFYGNLVFGKIPVNIDNLSAWFILIVNFACINGAWYGIGYMKPYEGQKANTSLHWVVFVFFYVSMLSVCTLQNSLAFLVAWETMSVSSFLLLLFEHNKHSTIKAGLNYLVQMHIGVAFLTIGFIWINLYTGTYYFRDIAQYANSVNPAICFLLFLCFFIGFAFKAGFVPFHTWLPYAHPAAPSHVSGIMSGVMIKMGIYGILRMLLLIKGNYLAIGYFILVISVITGIYGVMLAIIQHNIKKLLAYHSIENIGIIGIGIGLGCIGLGLNNQYLAFAGFAGALLHTLNHSLFKALLFYCTGTVYQLTRTLDIERLGGLIKKMPRTAVLFLIAALAICGLPPFNGFISEFLIYSGLFKGLISLDLTSTTFLIMSIVGLVFIGGMAILCFTKAFGIIFLGSERSQLPASANETELSKLLPNYIIAALIILIGVVPQLFIQIVAKPASLFTSQEISLILPMEFVGTLQTISIAVIGFILLSAVIFMIKKTVARSAVISTSPTWGCGYILPSPRQQYTASSFVRPFKKLIRPFLMLNKKEEEIKDVFPVPVHSESHPYDKLESILIDVPITYLQIFMRRLRFFQNGSTQFYILYGVVFIFIIILIPLLINTFEYLLELFYQI